MLGLARNWGAGGGPLALLACPPGERHDLGLLAFGVVLRDRGWRITYLGPDTPIETIARTAAELRPGGDRARGAVSGAFEPCSDEIAVAGRDARVLIGGEGATRARRSGSASRRWNPSRCARLFSSPGSRPDGRGRGAAAPPGSALLVDRTL